MAGDKLGSNGHTKTISQRPKIFKNEDFLIGYTTSFRMGQLLEFTWSPPEKRLSQTEDNYIYTTVIDSIKNTLTSDGFAKEDKGGEFLFGYKGKLYHMQSDFAIFEIEDYTACGCGADMAKATIYTLDNVTLAEDLSVEGQLALAIESAASTMTGVSVDYDYLTL
jgi:hypothetical protein